MGLVATELVLAIWLATGSALPRSTLASVGLHAMYFFWIGTALLRGLSLANCGCFGVYLARPLTGWTLLEDGVLLLLALLLWKNSGQRY